MARGGKRPNTGPKLGSEQRKTAEIRLDLIATLRDKGFDPLAELIWAHNEARDFYASRKEKKDWLTLSALSATRETAISLMEFVYPKRKAVELTGAQGADLFQSFTDLVKELAKSDATE